MLDKLRNWLPKRPRLDRGGIVDGELDLHRDEEILDDYDGQRPDSEEPNHCPWCGSEEIGTSRDITDEWLCRCYQCTRDFKAGVTEI